MAGIKEMRVIRAELQRRLPGGSRTSYSYIASILSEAGVTVQYAGAAPRMEEPYSSRLKDALHFHDLASAENSLRNLDAAYRSYFAAGDLRGMNLVRAILLKGKQRALQLAANPRVREEKRREKREIASCFTVWLQTPDIFSDWLGLRKQSEEFRREFGEGSDFSLELDSLNRKS